MASAPLEKRDGMRDRLRHATGRAGLSAALALAGLVSAEAQGPPRPVLLAERLTLHSRALGEDREVLVHLPEGYEHSSRTYPVLYLLDGEYFFLQAISAVQFLSELGYDRGQQPIPQMIVVGIVNVDRNRDYTPTHAPEQGSLRFPTGGGGDRFLAFLTGELIPYVDARFRTQPFRTVAGWSLGGLFTVETWLTSAESFSMYLAVSPSLWWDDAVALEQTKAVLGHGGLTSRRLVVTLGSLEGGPMDQSVRRGFVPLMKDRAPASADFSFVEIPGEPHERVPYRALHDGLEALFADWAVPTEVLGKGLEAVERFYGELSRRTGSAIDVPLPVYRQLASTLPDVESALAAARQAVAHYPFASSAFASLGRLQQLKGDLDAARTSYERALELELGATIPYSERLLTIRRRLDALRRP